MRRIAAALFVFATLTLGSGGLASSASAGSGMTEYEQAHAYALAAYEYGLPLLDLNRTFRTSTSVNVTNGRGGGAVNRFNHFRKLADAKDRTVVLPNSDTLYSMAWIDLRRGPQVIHTKKGTKRFHVLELMDPYSENFANIGSPRGARPDGDYLVVRKKWKGKKPRGLKLIRSPYDRIWIIGRTLVLSQKDLPRVHKVQNTFRITPLKKWNPKRPYSYRYPKPKKVDRTKNEAHIPGTGAGEDPAAYFDALGDLLKRFPPPARDRAILGTLKKTLGIGPGLHPVAGGKLSEDQLDAMRDVVTDAPARMQSDLLSTYFENFDIHNGWVVARTGHYGTDYHRRAQIARFGLGAPTPNVAMYPVAVTDHNRVPLNGARRYVVHFDADQVKPPVKFFWSLTLYDNDSFFVDNPIDRYLLNDRSKLALNPDGSLDIYVQPNRPADPQQVSNWLPSPAADAAQPAFRLTMRLYGLSKKGIRDLYQGTGWQLPSILPCGNDNKTPSGIDCAAR
jgi:hypothetical protein